VSCSLTASGGPERPYEWPFLGSRGSTEGPGLGYFLPFARASLRTAAIAQFVSKSGRAASGPIAALSATRAWLKSARLCASSIFLEVDLEYDLHCFCELAHRELVR